eukprot:87979_1
MVRAVPLTPVRANQQPVCNESGGSSEVKTPGLVNNVMCKDFDKKSGLDVDSARNSTTPVRIRDEHYHPVSDEISGSSSSHVVNKGVTSTPVSDKIGDYSSRVRTPGLMNNVMCEDFLVTPGVNDDNVRDSHRRHSFCTPGGKSKARPHRKFSKDKDCEDRSGCSTPAVTAGYKWDSGEGSVLRGTKRSLSELFSPPPGPAEEVRMRKHLSYVPSSAVDKGTAGIWADASDTKRKTAVEGEVDVSDDILRISNSDDICIVELLLNSKYREGIQMLKSWRLGDLKRRLVLLGYFDSEDLITIKTRFIETAILPDDKTVGDLDKNDVIVVECV